MRSLLIHLPSLVASSLSHKLAINKGEAAGARSSPLWGSHLYHHSLPSNPNHLLHPSHLSSESKARRIEGLGGSRGPCKEELRHNLGIGVFYFSCYFLVLLVFDFLFSIMDVIFVIAPMRG
jgi:hypothetical protein